MNTIKWVMAVILAVVTAVLGVGLAIGATIFAAALQILGGIAIAATFLAMYIKERLDTSSHK